MQYRKDKYGNDVSILGYGCMRFSKKAGMIDVEKASKEIMAAYEAGINYYDTAYIYPGNEAALGRILEENGIREDVYIATKLPHYLIRKQENMEKMFAEELKRLRTDYVDYYLMHMLTDVKSWERLKELGVEEWIDEKKKTGQIRQIGFSYHGNKDAFCALIDAYDWDFCMIQYNYLDENTQAGRKGLEYAASKGVPVLIMEPLRGGKLVNNIPKDAQKLFDAHPSGRTPAQWAFRWLWSQEQVMCVLSGMNSMEMLRENLDTADGARIGEMTGDDDAFLRDVVEAMYKGMKVGCTACGYCMPCPAKVDIPGCFSAYNKRYSDGYMTAMREYLQSTTLRKEVTAASNCIGCGACEKHCPQSIKIRDELAEVRKKMEGPVYKIANKVVRTFMKY